MFRFTPHRLAGTIAFWIAGLVMFCLHGARIGGAITVGAHAEETAPLAAINELVKHKGLEVAPERACDGFGVSGPFDFGVSGPFDSKNFAKNFAVVGVTAGRGDLAKINPKYPKDYDASIVRTVDRHAQSTKVGQLNDLVLRVTNPILCRISRQNMPSYAFFVDILDGHILEAAVSERAGNAYRWSVVARDVGVIELGAERPNEMAAKMQDIFSTEFQLWSGTAMRHFVEELPDKR